MFIFRSSKEPKGAPNYQQKEYSDYRNKEEYNAHPKNNKNGSKNHMIQEQNAMAGDIMLKAICNDINFNVLVDTGSRLNFMSQRCINELKGIKIQEVTQPFKMITANNETVKVDKYVDLIFAIDQLPNINFKTKFYILENMPCDCNVGLQFLKEHRSSIDIENEGIKTEDHIIEYKDPTEIDLDTLVTEEILIKTL